jgi:hypothetical protein
MPKALARPKLAELCACVKPVPALGGFEAASLEPVEFSGLSMSISPEISISVVLLCRLWRLELMDIDRDTEDAPGPGVDFGGAAAMGTTPLPPTALATPWKFAGVLLPAAVTLTLASSGGVSLLEGAPLRLMVAEEELLFKPLPLASDETASDEFFRDAAAEFVPEALFFDLVPAPPLATLGPEPRLRFLMTSVFKLSGLTTP